MTMALASRRTRRLLLALIAITVSACTEQLDDHENAIVHEWLICIDCGPQLDSLRALGTQKKVATADSLNGAMLHGPAAVELAGADSVFALAYARDSSYRFRNGRPPLALTRPAHVAANHQRYADGYQSRGALGLGWMGTPRATAYLTAAAVLQLSPTVRRAAQFGHDSIPPPP
jgi:hypothetical protein